MHTKVCPRCGQQLFDDMPICYECLYEFSAQEEVVPISAYEDGGGEGPQSAACPTLLHIRTASVDLSVPVPVGGLTIGRGTSCDVVLHTPAVSRRHVRIELCGEGVLVTNLGARNPPTVDGIEVLETTLLEQGNELLVCGSSFSLED